MMRLRLLGQSGLRVSELCLGTMTFGDAWGWGADQAASHAMFEAFVEAGGNFIDTANNYTNGLSERLVGECLRPHRDHYVVATKYTLRVRPDDPRDANLGGNSRKSLMRSVENSLRRLETDYIDVLYLHMWDFTTPVEEILHAVQTLVLAGKVLYFAFSDTPAWVVSYALARAEAYGWPRPVAVQAPYSLLDRSVERAEWPMARAHGLAQLAWGVLEGGALTGKYSQPADGPRREASVSETERAAGEAVLKVARELGRPASQVALNWVRQQPGNPLPILGARSAAQLRDNLGCLDFQLSDAHLAELAAVSNFKPGFPTSFLLSDHVRGLILGDTAARL